MLDIIVKDIGFEERTGRNVRQMVNSQHVKLTTVHYCDSASDKEGAVVQVKGWLLWSLDSWVARAVCHLCTVILR